MQGSSPFKFLDAYGKDDKDIFFGRDDEVDQLYELVFQSNLTLVYGQSGTGKTSLIQCGLANRFEQSDWFNVFIRRNNDINESLIQSLKKYKVRKETSSHLLTRLQKIKQATGRVTTSTTATSQSTENILLQTLRSIYKHYLKPVYLIFDQFEEIFILGNKQEQRQFYRNVASILKSEAYCRVILIMREEAIAQLYDFEKVVPFLFDKRLRVEPMSRAKTQEVIRKTTTNYDIDLEDDTVPEQVIEVLSEGEGRVELTYLQVFLDRLYQEAEKADPQKIVFTSRQIQRLGSIEDVLGDFLSGQITEVDKIVRKTFPKIHDKAVRNVLGSLVTLEGTKRPLSVEQITIGRISPDQRNLILSELDKRRILRQNEDVYELSHDILARQVAEQRSKEEVALLQIAKMVTDRYEALEQTKTYLNGNELQLLNEYRKELDEENYLNAEKWAFVNKSSRKNRMRRISRLAVAGVFVAMLVAFLVYSQVQLAIVQQAQADQKIASYQYFLTTADNHIKEGDFDGAVEFLRLAEGMEEETELENDTFRFQNADSLLMKTAEMKDTKVKYDRIVQDGDSLLAIGLNLSNTNIIASSQHYRQSWQKFQEALNLGYEYDADNQAMIFTRPSPEQGLDDYYSDAGQN